MAIKMGRYGVESISIWCPECFEFASNPLNGSLTFTEEEYPNIPEVFECAICGQKFKRPPYPEQKVRYTKR